MPPRLRHLRPPTDAASYFSGALCAAAALMATLRWSGWALSADGLRDALFYSCGTVILLHPTAACWRIASRALAEGAGVFAKHSDFSWMYCAYAAGFGGWALHESCSLLSQPALTWPYKAAMALALNLFCLMAVCWLRASLAARNRRTGAVA